MCVHPLTHRVVDSQRVPHRGKHGARFGFHLGSEEFTVNTAAYSIRVTVGVRRVAAAAGLATAERTRLTHQGLHLQLLAFAVVPPREAAGESREQQQEDAAPHRKLLENSCRRTINFRVGFLFFFSTHAHTRAVASVSKEDRREAAERAVTLMCYNPAAIRTPVDVVPTPGSPSRSRLRTFRQHPVGLPGGGGGAEAEFCRRASRGCHRHMGGGGVGGGSSAAPCTRLCSII